MPKENKVSSPSSSHSQSKSQNLSQTAKVLGTKIKPIGKIQSFSKKESILSSLKKKKVLCETSLTATTSSTVSGSNLVNQIPRKKIKVSSLNVSIACSSSFMKGESTSSSLNVSTTDPLKSELSNFILSTAKSLDEEMVLKAPSSPSGSSNSSSQLKITSFLPLKKLIKKKKLKFRKPTARIGCLEGVKKVKSSVDDTEPGHTHSLEAASTSHALSQSSKLLKKKKRSLKSERKKSRSQKPLLH